MVYRHRRSRGRNISDGVANFNLPAVLAAGQSLPLGGLSNKMLPGL